MAEIPKEYIEFEEYFEGGSPIGGETNIKGDVHKKSLIEGFNSKVAEIKSRVNPKEKQQVNTNFNSNLEQKPQYTKNFNDRQADKGAFKTELDRGVEVLKFDKVMADSPMKGNEGENEVSFEENQDRIEMENEFEIAKELNELKEKNERLEKVIKYQNMKLDSLENEIGKLVSDINEKDLELEELRGKGKTPNNEFKKIMAQLNNSNNQVEKLKNQLSEKTADYNALLEKYNSLQRSMDEATINEKKSKQELLNKEKKIARLIEELDKKENLGNNSGKNTNPNIEKEVDRLKNEVKKQEKQKNEIYAAFKKSLKLCSVLKRQKIHLENARLLNFTEEEFKQLLEQNKV